MVPRHQQAPLFGFVSFFNITPVNIVALRVTEKDVAVVSQTQRLLPFPKRVS